MTEEERIFLKELKYALQIIDEGHFSRKQFKGSWAGAFGQTQFMPSTFKSLQLTLMEIKDKSF